jgi:hypothetical protein
METSEDALEVASGTMKRLRSATMQAIKSEFFAVVNAIG